MSSLVNVTEASTGKNGQHSLYTLSLPLGTTINKMAEFADLQNQLQAIQSLQLQALQSQNDEVSIAFDSGGNFDDSEIPQDDETWSLPLIYEEQPMLLNGLENFVSQNMLNGEQDISDMTLPNDSDIDTSSVQIANDSTGAYTINVDGQQYGFHWVDVKNDSMNSNIIHCSDNKYVSNVNHIPVNINQSDLTDNLIEYDPNDLTEIAHVMTAYKCRKCDYTIYDKDEFLEHFTDYHLNTKEEYLDEILQQDDQIIDESNQVVQTQEIAPKENFAIPDLHYPDVTMESEPQMYLCGQCSKSYSSIDECRDHMIRDHKLKTKSPTSEAANNKNHETSNDEIRMKEKETTVLGANNSNSKVSSANVISDKHNHVITTENSKDNSEESHWLLPKSIKELKTALLSNWKARCGVTTCLYRFKDTNSLAKHVACHLPNQTRRKSPTTKMFKCSECAQDFMNWRACSLHLWKEHSVDVDMLTCPVCCEYKTYTLVKLSHHLKIHSSIRGFVCNQCGKAFKQPTQLRNHTITHLKDRNDQSVKRWYTEKNCEICSKTFADSKCLKKHIQSVHSKIRPFICNVCGHSCTRKAMLQMHLRQHTGEKPYSCTDCDYKTSDHNTLRRHLMRHKGIRPYQCPYCPYAAIQSCAYKTHLRKKHEGKPGLFSCTICAFKTVNEKILESHLIYHKKGLIRPDNMRDSTGWRTYTGRNDGVEVFPGNIAAARLVYSCLGEGPPMASITQTNTRSQTLTIQIPARESEDDETQHCFLAMHRNDTAEEDVDRGGVTIPADIEQSQQAKDV